MRRILILITSLAAVAASATSVNAAKLGERCGGFAGIPCGAGQWCEMKPGQCNAADMFGTCVQVPEVCATIYKPVCACDSKTYGNDCERRRARVSKNHDGECRS